MDGYAIRAADVAGGDRGPARPPDGRRRVAGRRGARCPGAARDARSGSRPAPRCPRARTPWCRSRSRRRWTPAATPGHADATRPGRFPRRAWSTRRSTAGNAVRTRGSDVEAGATVVDRAVTVTPAVVALASGAGLADVVVRRRPIVAVLATGDELRAAGIAARRRRASRTRTAPRSGRWSARPAGSRWSSGSRSTGSRTSRRGCGAGIAEADLIVVSGGVSVGPYDVVAGVRRRRPHEPVARRHPAGQAVHVRPRGRRRPAATRCCCSACPGNPVSSFVTFELFVRPVIRRLAGQRAAPSAGRPGRAGGGRRQEPGPARLPAGDALRGADGSPMRDEKGRVRVRLAGGQGSHVISALAAADALAVVPEPLARAEAGTEVELRWLDRRRSPRPLRSSVQEGPWIARVHARRAPPADPRGSPRPAADGRRQRQARRPPAARSPRPRSRSPPETMSLVIDGGGSKGDVLTVAELAGVMGGKRTSELIPLCHPHRADGPRGVDHAGPRRRRAPDPRRGRDDGPDGRRDGGDDGGVGRRADRVRHGQGRRARRRGAGRPARVEDRRQERRVAPARAGDGPAAAAEGGSPATGSRAGWASAGAPDAPARVGARADRERPERRGHAGGRVGRGARGAAGRARVRGGAARRARRALGDRGGGACRAPRRTGWS